MPSLSVSLDASEYEQVAKMAKKEKVTPNAMVAQMVRSYLVEESR
jgi:metal-responsive CopG/Arc/MetJ family transcriptional regulator